MLSKNDIKLIKSLELKKYRQDKGLFVAEGHKLIGDLLNQMECKLLAATHEYIETHRNIEAERIETVSHDELSRASLLRAPQDVIALFAIPQHNDANMAHAAASDIVLALDDVQDPGNLGTIVRIADWFGIRHIFCSKGTADIYNPKSIQATMGAIARVKVHYTDLKQSLAGLPDSIPIYGTFLEGDIIYNTPLTGNGVIVMGNEGNGINRDIKEMVSRKLYIPNWPEGEPTSESLNVAIATAVVCSEFRRQMR